METRDKARAARAAARKMMSSADEARRAALRSLADSLLQSEGAILAANAKDLDAASDLDGPLRDRLHLTPEKINTVAEGCRQIADMDDPLGRTLRSTVLDDGLHLYQVSCPLGVVACIFESRPDVVVQIASLAIRTGNAVLLKGGREAEHSNAALAALVREALADAGLPDDAVQLLQGREEVTALLELDGDVDLIIPRGGNELVRHIQANTKIPVLGHAEGVCHLYVDAAADLATATRLIIDSKTDYPAACNAVETVLVHESRRDDLPTLIEALTGAGITVQQGGAATFGTEYGAPTLDLGLVPDLDAAVAHITEFGSGHTDGIITEDDEAARRFVAAVDSAGVYVNASTRFADGYRYGLGAEVGISTGRIHARGPVGLDGLLSTRWILIGHGQTAATYRDRPFLHEPSARSFADQEAAWK